MDSKMKNEKRPFKIIKMEAKTLSWWRTRKALIDMEPSYQRKGRRWSVSDKQYLIDSILNGFDIPKFYVVDFTWGSSKLNEKNVDYAVIDGKQRLETIFDFFADSFSLSQTFSLISNPDLNIAGLKYSTLKESHPDIAELFENFNPDVMTVITEHQEYIEELFIRLNRSKPLSGAEIRNAIPGDASHLIRQLREHDFFKSNIKFNTSRGQDLNCAAKILMFELSENPRQETKKSSLDRFTKDNTKIPGASIKIEQINNILNSMSETFQFQDQLLTSEGPIPIYYWLFRNQKTEQRIYIRDFLVYFNNSIKNKNEEILSSTDREAYIAANRSVNDKNSHVVRYEILKENFDLWFNSNLRTP